MGVICKRYLFYAHFSSELKEPLKRTSCRVAKKNRIITSHTTAPETKSQSQAFPQKNRSRHDFFTLPFVIKFSLSISTLKKDRHFLESKSQNWGKKRPVWTSLKPEEGWYGQPKFCYKTIHVVLNQLCSSLWTSRSWFLLKGHFYRKQKQILLVDPSTKLCVDTGYQSTTVSGSHLEVGVKNCPARLPFLCQI